VSEFSVIRPVSSVSNAVSAASANYTAPNAGTYRFISNRNAHVSLGESAATVTDMFIPNQHETFFSLAENEKINFIRATGETDGLVWITRIVRS
jgi:hypothetical protein